jgi:hypothetical protein
MAVYGLPWTPAITATVARRFPRSLLCFTAMDRASLERRLANAQKHITEGERHVAAQQKLIQRMARLGRDTTRSQRLLETFEETLRLHMADRDKLLRELDEPPS